MAQKSHGTLFKIGDGAGTEAFTTIGEVLDINFPEFILETEDATHHSSGGVRESISIIRDVGEATFTVQYDPADSTHNASTGLIADWKNEVLRNFEVVLLSGESNEETHAFAAYVANLQISTPVAGKVTMDVTLDVSGDVTIS